METQTAYRRSGKDRHRNDDRREFYDLDYFNHGLERRADTAGRRKLPEMRSDWERISEWVSEPITNS
ncbi:MAG: hypothetical protein GY850_06960 [bacterium]|nr:hypothetical protein [bacterium]